MKHVLVLLLVILGGCSSNKPSSPPPKEVPSVSGGLKPITQVGVNLAPRFSNDGTKIIYQSRSRPNHKGSQIYIMNLSNMREKRITYNDGEDFSPSFDSTGKYIYYSSTTDEMKEHPENANWPNILNLNPAEIIDPTANFEEIYESESDGSHIQRLTKSVGFDGNASPSPDGKHTVFVSQRAGNFELYFMDPRGRTQNRILKSTDVMARPSFSPDGKIIVFEARAPESNSVQIKTIPVVGKSPTQVTNKEAVNRDPSWTPDNKHIVFASNRELPNVFLIYMVNADGTCLKKLSPAFELKSKVDTVADLYPVISPDGKKLLFSSNRSGRYELYLIDFEEPKDCLEDKG